jgi:hypothetical protein
MSNSRYLAASDAKTPMDREIGHQPTTASSRPPSSRKFTCATPVNVNVTVDRFSLKVIQSLEMNLSLDRSAGNFYSN